MRGSVMALGLSVLFVVGCSPDEREYVRDNVRVLDELPTVPGARHLHQSSASYKESEWAWAGVAGYGTSRSFTLPPRVSQEETVAFYRQALRGGWEVVDGPSREWASFRRGDVWLSVQAFERGEYWLQVDHDCYKGDDWPHCFGP